MLDTQYLKSIARYIRSLVLCSTTKAGLGHPTSCLSAVEIVTTLWFDGFIHFDIHNPKNINNDKFILSKGHAAPLLYSLWVVAGLIKEDELMTLRTFNSSLEGHPSIRHLLVDVATGSLGQGLSIGVGMGLAAKKLGLDNKIYVLLGDGEMEEGSNYEALQIASYYKLNNLIGIIDVNGLEQEGETMLGNDPHNGAITLKKRAEAFGWETIVINGHSFDELHNAFKKTKEYDRPVMLIAKTTKGKGVSFFESKQGWHGKALNDEQLKQALEEIGVHTRVSGQIIAPIPKERKESVPPKIDMSDLPDYKIGDKIAPRKAYGTGLVKSALKNPNIICLDAGVANSTYAETFKKNCPANYYEMFIAEQNMVGVAMGMSKYGFVPFASTFGAFLTRAHDQIRMAGYSNADIKFIGSHVGVSIGADGPSQMGLEDLSMFRSILDSVVLYPSDAISTEVLVEVAAKHKGIVYLRTTRADTSVLYDENELFSIGGSKALKKTDDDKVVIFAAGITVHEALRAHDDLAKENISVCVVDTYSVKPLDEATIKNLSLECENVVVVEDHYSIGGLGEAIAGVLVGLPVKFVHLAVEKMPPSGTSQELLDYEEISSDAIVTAIKNIL